MSEPFIEAIRAFNGVVDDSNKAIAVLDAHPELFQDQAIMAELIYSATRRGLDGRVVAELLRRGAPVNAVTSVLIPSRPIMSAVTANSVGAVRAFLEYGAEVNWGFEVKEVGTGRVVNFSPVYPIPLQHALMSRDTHFEIIKLLVEAGSMLNARDKMGATILDCTGACRPEVVEYLRSQGAKHARELPGYVPPPPPSPVHPVFTYGQTVFGGVQDVPLTPVLPEAVPVAIHSYDGYNSPDDICALFTAGMSDRPMTVPPGGEVYQYAELLVQFRYNDYWSEEGDWLQDKSRWLVQWLHRVAQIPFETNTWLGGKWGVISNEEPPEPLSAFTPMTCWLLLAEKEPLTRLELDDGRSVVFYTMIPIHTAERDLALREGVVALLQKFADNDVPDYLVPDRPSVV